MSFRLRRYFLSPGLERSSSGLVVEFQRDREAVVAKECVVRILVKEEALVLDLREDRLLFIAVYPSLNGQ